MYFNQRKGSRSSFTSSRALEAGGEVELNPTNDVLGLTVWRENGLQGCRGGGYPSTVVMHQLRCLPCGRLPACVCQNLLPVTRI